MKRQDEKAVTERAYDNPVFVEDLVRKRALKLNAHPDVTWYKVEAENQESIHNHNAYACIREAKRGEPVRPVRQRFLKELLWNFAFLCYIPALSKGKTFPAG